MKIIYQLKNESINYAFAIVIFDYIDMLAQPLNDNEEKVFDFLKIIF